MPSVCYNIALEGKDAALNDQIFRHPICRLLPALNTKIRFLGVRDRQIPSFLDNVPVNLNPAPRTLIRPRIGQSCSRRGDGRWAGVYSRWGQLGQWTRFGPRDTFGHQADTQQVGWGGSGIQ